MANKPVFFLALDAMSAYDRCLRQILSAELYKADIKGTALNFIDSRLENRATAYEWNGEVMGPSKDDKVLSREESIQVTIINFITIFR